jgi:endonuclease/exonuclease/phosphatase family metal-dependent hydrolase
MRLRLITWNIHKGVGGIDRRYKPERIVETLGRYAPDVVHMQEVTDGVPRCHRHRQIDLIGDALNLPFRAYQPNVRLSEGSYGNAILSRFPLHDIQDIDLKVPLKKRRRAQVARCRAHLENGHSRTIILVNLHLGLAEFERRIQLRRVLEFAAVKRAHHGTPLIVAGDLNDVLARAGRQALQPVGFRSGCDTMKTFPAFMPLRALDQIHFRGQLALDRCVACPTPLASWASDHLPLIADFNLS